MRQSPFNLCQVPGFGFKRIDAIVQKSGGDLRDPKRVHGALFYALEDARTKDGHLYLEVEALLKAAMQLLNERIPLPQMRVPMSQVEQELSAMIRQDEVVSNHGNVYLPKQFLQESETAQKAVELFLANPAVVDIAQPLERVKHSLGLNLSKRQSEGVEMVFRHNLSIITGGPGTGKTTVLKTVIEVYRQLYPRQKIVLGAPTGKASRRMAEATGIDEAQTLHSILGLHGDSESKKDRERKPLEAGLLIVDETSMVDMWLIHQLFSRLRPGTKVLLVGDADQLESVGAGDVFHELIGSGVVPVTVLDEIFRQAQDSLIAHNARFINEGIPCSNITFLFILYRYLTHHIPYDYPIVHINPNTYQCNNYHCKYRNNNCIFYYFHTSLHFLNTDNCYCNKVLNIVPPPITQHTNDTNKNGIYGIDVLSFILPPAINVPPAIIIRNIDNNTVCIVIYIPLRTVIYAITIASASPVICVIRAII